MNTHSMRLAGPACLLALLAAACDSPEEQLLLSGPRAVVCEPGATSTTEVPIDQLAVVTGRGGYVARLLVDRETPMVPGVTFRRITDAVAEARRIRQVATAQGCRLTIVVSAGTYVGSTGTTSDPALEQWPIVLDMPNVTLLGVYEMPLSTAGRATGPAAASARATVLTASPPLAVSGGPTPETRFSEPMIAVDTDGARRGNGARIEGFVFRSGHAATDVTTGGVGVLTLRTPGVEVIGNSFEGNFTERVDVREGGAVVERNYSSGRGGTCDICINGPGNDFLVRGNTLVGGGVPGVLILPTILLPLPPAFTQIVPPAKSTTKVLVDNNDVSGHQSIPVGTGFRVGALGNGAPNTQGDMHVTFTGNRSAFNRFGLIVEAGFPVAGTPLRGDISITTANNTFLTNCQSDLLVSLSRHNTGLGLASLPYLRSSTYNLELGPDLPFASAWYAHPAGLGNTLRVSGVDVAPGTRAPYQANKTCVVS